MQNNVAKAARTHRYYTPLIALFCALLFVLPLHTTAQEANAGFVEGLWYSKQPLFAEEPVRIYAALRNNTDNDLTGVVTFKDGDTVIAKKEVSAISGRLVETWTDWMPSYGEHTLSAELSDVKLHVVGEAPSTVTVANSLSEHFTFVDKDTDSDGIGNKKDTDDDNDGASDKEEKSAGTDPLDPESFPEGEKQATTSAATAATTSRTATASQEEETETAEPEGPRSGFETHFGEGAVGSLLSSVTERVHESKRSLDAYRERRSAETETTKNQYLGPATTTKAETGTTTETGAATITRTQIDEKDRGVLEMLVGGIARLLSSLYTLLLWITSKALGYPGLVQFLLLLTILIGIYKLAKWYGNRQQ